MPSFVGEELSDGERVALEAHLTVCSACEAEAAKLRESSALLYGLAEGEPPAGTYVNIWNAVRDEFFPARIHRTFWGLSYAALFLIGISVGFLFVSTRGGAPADRPLAGEPTLGDSTPLSAGGNMEPSVISGSPQFFEAPSWQDWIGVRAGPRRSGEPGAKIQRVDRRSPAHRAGLKPGDVLLELDGKPVENQHALRWRIVFLRDGEKKETEVPMRLKKKEE